MGLQKLGITLAEQCARYAKSCGKSSILCTKPVHISNIKGLRYARGLTEDVVQVSKRVLTKPSKEKLSIMLKEQGLSPNRLYDEHGIQLGKIGFIEEEAEYIVENNSLFLEELIARFPLKAGHKTNREVQKYMLYLQDINHSAYADKQKFLTDFIEKANELDKIMSNKGLQLYTDEVSPMYTKKAILQAKYNDKARYNDIENILSLYKRGLVPEHTVQTFFPNGRFNPLPKSDIDKLMRGECYYPKLTEISDVAIKNLSKGEAFSVGDMMFVKTETGFDKLKIDRQTYERLFPPVERYSIAQSNSVENCTKVSTWNCLIKNPDTRIDLYKMFEQTNNGVRVTIPNCNYTYEFNWNNIQCLNTSNNIQGALGHRMLEYTYDVNKIGKLHTSSQRGYGYPNIMIYDITGKGANSAVLKPKGLNYELWSKRHSNGIYIRSGENNLNNGLVDEHAIATTDLSSNLWQNPWTGIEDVPYRACAFDSVFVDL